MSVFNEPFAAESELPNSRRCEQIFVQPAATRKQMDPFADAIYGAGTDLIETELVNDQYVMNKLKLILFPVLHKGHWMRETETSTLTYKPSIDDVNAPDLYIPLMAFGTYVVLAGFLLGISGKQLSLEVFQCRFSPEALGVQATNGMLGWLFQVLLEATLRWRRAISRHSCLRWIHICCCFHNYSLEDDLELQFVCSSSVGMFVYGDVACEDHQENFDCRG
ncbi:hypothetical protein Gotur_006094 [Gossypium turneri]